MILKNIGLLLFIPISLSACSSDRFQPPPPMYTWYTKDGATENDVKAAMFKCGYTNAIGNSRNDTLNEMAKRDHCMFQHGYQYRSGNQEICNRRPYLPACQTDTQ